MKIIFAIVLLVGIVFAVLYSKELKHSTKDHKMNLIMQLVIILLLSCIFLQQLKSNDGFREIIDCIEVAETNIVDSFNFNMRSINNSVSDEQKEINLLKEQVSGMAERLKVLEQGIISIKIDLMRYIDDRVQEVISQFIPLNKVITILQ